MATARNGEARTAGVRALNDTLRRTFTGGRVLITPGITALSETDQVAIMAAVRAFDRFDADNDPHREHDCALVTVGELRVIWKIDAYDRALAGHSPDPADPGVTTRVLTVMLAEEY